MIQHPDETDPAFEFLATVLISAVEDLQELRKRGLVQGQTLNLAKWPKGMIAGKMSFVMLDNRMTFQEAETTLHFLFKGGAERFFKLFDISINAEKLVDEILEKLQNKEKK